MSIPESRVVRPLFDESQAAKVARRVSEREEAEASRKATQPADLGGISDFEPCGAIDGYALEEARVRLARRDYADTLHYLEIALGRDFIGLSDLVLGERS